MALNVRYPPLLDVRFTAEPVTIIAREPQFLLD